MKYNTDFKTLSSLFDTIPQLTEIPIGIKVYNSYKKSAIKYWRGLLMKDKHKRAHGKLRLFDTQRGLYQL